MPRIICETARTQGRSVFQSLKFPFPDNHDDARKESVDSKYPVLYLPYNHKLTPSDVQYYQHPVYVTEERPPELSYQESEIFPTETEHFTTNQPVGTHHYDIVTESKQITNPRTAISEKEDPFILKTLTTNVYKFDTALEENILKVLKHGRRQGYTESQDSKESNSSSQNAAYNVSSDPSDDLYKKSPYYIPLSKYSESPLNLSQDSQTKHSYDGPDSYNPPAIIYSYGTPIEQSGDNFPPLDMYETLKRPAQNKSYTYPLDIYKFPSPVNSYQSQSFPATYKAPSIIQTYKPPSLEDTYKSPSLEDNYKPVKLYKHPLPEDSYGPPSLMEILKPPEPVDTDQSLSMETYKPESPEDSYGPPPLINIYKPPSLMDIYHPSSMETYKLLSPEDSYRPLSLMDIYKPPSSTNVHNFSLPANTHKPPFSVDDYKTSHSTDKDKSPLVMETHKPTTHMNVYKLPSSMDISNLSPPPPPPPSPPPPFLKPYNPPPPAADNKPPINDETYEPPLLNYPRTNVSSDMSPPYNDDRPLNVIHKFPSFKRPHEPHMSSDITIKDSYTMPLSEEQHRHNSSSEDGLSDDDGHPEYDTKNHDSHDYDTYDSTKNHISHDDSHGRDHDHSYNHDPSEYYYRHHSYDQDDHEMPAVHPPSKDYHHHPPSYKYEGGVPHDHYHDHIYHHDPNEYNSDHDLHDYDGHELPATQRPTKYFYRYPSSYVYTVETPSLPEEPSPPKDMVGNFTPPSNGMVGSSTPPANNMVGPATSPPPDTTQGPPPPLKNMVGVLPSTPNDMYEAYPHPPPDMYMNHLYPVEGTYGVHPPIYVYGRPTHTDSSYIMTEAPQTSTMPIEKKPPNTYYYLGRKLWLVPVYATGIMLVQMLVLLLKSIAKHKLLKPFNFYTSLQSRNLKSQRQQELDSSTEHVTKALETAEYRYM